MKREEGGGGGVDGGDVNWLIRRFEITHSFY